MTLVDTVQCVMVISNSAATRIAIAHEFTLPESTETGYVATLPGDVVLYRTELNDRSRYHLLGTKDELARYETYQLAETTVKRLGNWRRN